MKLTNMLPAMLTVILCQNYYWSYKKTRAIAISHEFFVSLNMNKANRDIAGRKAAAVGSWRGSGAFSGTFAVQGFSGMSKSALC